MGSYNSRESRSDRQGDAFGSAGGGRHSGYEGGGGGYGLSDRGGNANANGGFRVATPNKRFVFLCGRQGGEG